ncbi:MAG: DUF3021 domain-containing protein [Oscillospiraceae bacterium]|nr:DUF3021 domain-containing protein [Oscillospiraceae bacterium]
MKKNVFEFFRRGLIACGFGPIVLAILYLILQHQAVVETLTVHQVCMGIFSLSALAFIAGGMNVVYQIERLPLMVAILIHGGVLYISYMATYLLNGWLEWGMTPILVFSAIFILGYLAVWVVIYSITKKRTEKLNELLKKNRQINPPCG